MTEPEQKAERRANVDDGFARTPRIDVVYKIPQGNTADYYALSLLGQILSSGQSSRLYQKLVKERELAAQVGAGAQERRGPSLFYRDRNRTSRQATRGCRESDLRRNRAREERAGRRLGNREGPHGHSPATRAAVTRHFEPRREPRNYSRCTTAMPNLINEIEAKYNSVTKEDIQRVARTYFKDTNRTVITTDAETARDRTDYRF